jgi:transcriptional regulator with XRE-family HTH domain
MAYRQWRERFREHLRGKEVTQEQVAERLDITQGAVAHWLSGRREINLSDFIRLCVAADADPKFILFGQDEKTRLITELRRVLGKSTTSNPDYPPFERRLAEAPKPPGKKKPSKKGR